MLWRVSYRVLQGLCVLLASCVRTRLDFRHSPASGLCRGMRACFLNRSWKSSLCENEQFALTLSAIRACSMLSLHMLIFCYMTLMFLGENLCWAGGRWGGISYHICSKCVDRNWSHNWQISGTKERYARLHVCHHPLHQHRYDLTLSTSLQL